ncbi:ricin-type beta-trefoil lectin domain protein [Kitasatospora sp. NPDC058965]|uniref:ricin-type beta-trefoil lectin domain protein n=1 Tax=Kitasatospora sp. NPDC058965 TaxID=3346682 RepID=UPI0036C8086F
MKRSAARGLTAATATVALFTAAPGFAPAAQADTAPARPLSPTGLAVAPVEPALFGTPYEGCGAYYQSWGYLPTGASSLTAKARGSAVTMEFHVEDSLAINTDVLVGTGAVGADGTASFALDSTKLLDGHSYAWHAVSRDAQGTASLPSTWCGFRIARTAPGIDFQPRAVQAPPHMGGWQYTLKYSAKAQTDGITPQGCLQYRINDDPTWIDAKDCRTDGAAVTGTVQFASPGNQTVHLRVVDQAGNLSNEVQLTTFVYPGPTLPGDLWDPAAQYQMSASTQGTPSLGGSPLAVTGGVSFVANSDTADGRPMPTSVAQLDGTGSIDGSGPLLDTGKDFSVTTWAKASPGGGVVLSQDGTQGSGLLLWASPWDNNWHFELSSSDTTDPNWDDTATRLPGAQVKYGTWQQLTATYNAQAGFLQLFVDGQPVASGYHPASAAWNAKGAVHIGSFLRQGSQTWKFHGLVSDLATYDRVVNYAQGTGSYSAVSASYNCVDATGGGNANGTRIELWNCLGSHDNQTFSSNRPDGTIRSMGKCLDVTGNATNNGAQIELWDCNGGGNQVWEPRADGSLFNPQSGRCLDVPFNRAYNYGTMLQLWDCNGGVNQQWNMPRGYAGAGLQ